jgi:hypothetical protein
LGDSLGETLRDVIGDEVGSVLGKGEEVGVLAGSSLGVPEGNSEARTLGDLLGSSVRAIGCFEIACTGACLGDSLEEGLGRALCCTLGCELGQIDESMLDASDGSDVGNLESSELGDLLGSPVRVIGTFVGAFTGALFGDSLCKELGTTL